MVSTAVAAVEASWAVVVVEFDTGAKDDIEAVGPVAAVVASAVVQQRDPLGFAVVAEGKHWVLRIVRQKRADERIQPKAIWRLGLQALILAAVAVAVAGETFQALEASEQQNTVKPLQLPAAAFVAANIAAATVVSTAAVADGADVDIVKDEAAVSPSLRELPRLNKSRIHQMD